MYLFISALHVSGFLLAHLQKQWVKSPGYGVSAQAEGRNKYIIQLKTCALRWSLYSFVLRRIMEANI
jgi:hypothetical protein